MLCQLVALAVCGLARIILAACAVWSLCGVKGQSTGFLLVFLATLDQGDYSSWLLRFLNCHLGHLILSGQQAGGLAQSLGAGVASGSRTIGSPSQGSGSACAVNSSLDSSTTGRLSVSADWVVLVSSFSFHFKGGFGESGGGTMSSGSGLAPGTCHVHYRNQLRLESWAGSLFPLVSM